MRPTCGSVADPWEAHIFRPTLQHDGPSYPFIPLLHFSRMRPTCGSVADPWEAHIFRPTSATRSTVFSRPTDVLAGNTLQHDGPSYPFIPLLHFKKYCKTKREWNLCGGFSRQVSSSSPTGTYMERRLGRGCLKREGLTTDPTKFVSVL
jgi:hypothetical protein